MLKHPNNKTTSLRFRRWSRAKYAVFCSLASVISIGCLSVSIADKSLQKAVGVSCDIFNKTSFDSEIDASETNDTEAILLQLKELNLSEISFDSAAACSQTLYFQYSSKRLKQV